jgi:hypothetical protein
MYQSNIIFFTHVPKCAGTSFDRGLATVFGSTYYRASTKYNPNKLTDIERSRIRVLSGHFQYYNEFESLFKRNKIYIATVRDPIARAISGYAYQHAKSVAQPERAQRYGLPIEESFDVMIRKGDGLVTNGQCQWLSGCTDGESAIEHVKNNYAAVVTPAGMLQLLRMLALSSPETSAGSLDDQDMHKNQSSANRLSLSSETHSRLVASSSADRQLYDWVFNNEQDVLDRLHSKLTYLSR